MDYSLASAFLAQIDADWERLVNTVGACAYSAKPAREPYEALVRAVAYQQLHARAADAILNRMQGLYAGRFPSPVELAATGFDDLRACGFSASKIATIQGIALGASTGIVPTRNDAQGMSNEELISRLVTLKGVGRWTVEMLLMFTLERMDVLPADDFAVREGYKRLKSLPLAPTPKALHLLGVAWSPYRSIASWYLWRVPR